MRDIGMRGRSLLRLALVAASALILALSVSGCEPPACTALEASLGGPSCAEQMPLNSPPHISEITAFEPPRDGGDYNFSPQVNQLVNFEAQAYDLDGDN